MEYVRRDRLGDFMNIEFKNGSSIKGIPSRVSYKRKENGLFFVSIEDYDIVAPDGNVYTGRLEFPNVSLGIDNDEGVILVDKASLDINALSQMCDTKNDKTLFTLIIPDEEDIMDTDTKELDDFLKGFTRREYACK